MTLSNRSRAARCLVSVAFGFAAVPAAFAQPGADSPEATSEEAPAVPAVDPSVKRIAAFPWVEQVDLEGVGPVLLVDGARVTAGRTYPAKGRATLIFLHKNRPLTIPLEAYAPLARQNQERIDWARNRLVRIRKASLVPPAVEPAPRTSTYDVNDLGERYSKVENVTLRIRDLPQTPSPDDVLVSTEVEFERWSMGQPAPKLPGPNEAWSWEDPAADGDVGNDDAGPQWVRIGNKPSEGDAE